MRRRNGVEQLLDFVADSNGKDCPRPLRPIQYPSAGNIIITFPEVDGSPSSLWLEPLRGHACLHPSTVVTLILRKGS